MSTIERFFAYRQGTEAVREQETAIRQQQEEDVTIKARCCFGLMSVLLSVRLAGAQATFTVFASGLENPDGTWFNMVAHGDAMYAI